MVAVTWVAYVDESMRQRLDQSGVYVMAAAVFDPTDRQRIRDAIRVVGRGRRPFHWRREEPADRRRAVAVVGSLDAVHLVVVGVGLDNPRQERGRRQCLTRMLWHLADAGVGRVWLDSRRPGQNAKDIQLVDALRTRGDISAELRMDFTTSRAEPLIWLADIVAGAVGAARGDADEQYVAPLKALLEEHVIDLR